MTPDNTQGIYFYSIPGVIKPEAKPLDKRGDLAHWVYLSPFSSNGITASNYIFQRTNYK